MTGYIVNVVSTSKDLSPKEKVMIKDTTDCVRMDEVTQESAVIIDVDYWAELAVHNEKSEDKDYANYVVVDKNGTRYVTGSTSFWNTFMNIWDEMCDLEGDGNAEPWSLKVYRRDSKNRAGKQFITCSVM